MQCASPQPILMRKKDPADSGIFVAEEPLDLVGAYQTRRLYTFTTMKISGCKNLAWVWIEEREDVAPWNPISKMSVSQNH